MILYFLEGIQNKSEITVDELRRRGLGDAFADCIRRPKDLQELLSSTNVFPNTGPGGNPGALICALPADGTVPTGVGLYPDDQEWKQVGEYWMGHDGKTTPDALRRKTPLISGNEVELGDGNEWIAPVVRMPMDGLHNLPASFGVNCDGDMIQSILPDYVEAWEMAGDLLEWYFGKREMTLREQFDYAVRCLSLNYRVGPHECTELNLLTSENLLFILGAAFDKERIDECVAEKNQDTASVVQNEVEKLSETEKKSADGVSSGVKSLSSAGRPGGSRDTDQITQTAGCSPTVMAATQ